MLATLLLGALMATSQDTTWAPLRRILNDAVARRAFPGAVVVIGRHDRILYQDAVGRYDYEHDEPVTLRTVYDIASLTKVVGLTTALMQLVHEGKVALDAPAQRYVPAFHDSTVTVRQLLTHTSGLPAFEPWHTRAHNRQQMYALANAEPLRWRPGERMVYSDIGAMVMTEIVERVSGLRLDRYLSRHLFTPLGMKDTRFNPPKSWIPRIAPTEFDRDWRHRQVRGEVHDERAAAMGGVSGHAGMFSTGPDLAKFAQMMLSCFAEAPGYRGTGAPVVDCDVVREWTRVQQRALSSRALGWDTPSGQSSAGDRLSRRSFGHTGFTGTSLWMDPEHDLFVLLLTNRVYPTRNNDLVFAVRRAVADVAFETAQAAGH